MSVRISALIYSVVSLLFITPFFAYAQTTANPTAPTTTSPSALVQPSGSTAAVPTDAAAMSSDDGLKAKYSKYQAAKDAFQQNLHMIKNQIKQTLVTQINDKLPIINANETARMTNSLTFMNNVLSRISTRASSLKSQGKNTSAVDSAVTNAQTLIASAQSAVSAQAAKQYTVSIVSEQTLRSTIGTTVDQMRQDLIAAQLTVKNARLAVLKAYQALLAVSGDGQPVASGSAQQVSVTVTQPTQ